MLTKPKQLGYAIVLYFKIGIFVVSGIGIVLIIASCASSRVIQITDYYRLKAVGSSPLYKARNEIYRKTSQGNWELIGVTPDPGWVQEYPFGMNHLSSKYYVVSRDGKSMDLATRSEYAGHSSGRPDGIYHFEYGEDARLLKRKGEYGIGAVSWPKPLPKEVLAFFDNTASGRPTMAYTGNGIASRLLLWGGTDLHAASFEGLIEKIGTLVAIGTDIDALTYWGDTALTLAIVGGREDAALKLIDSGAATNIGNVSPVFLAWRYGRSRVLERLAERHALFNETNSIGDLPLAAIFDDDKFYSSSSAVYGHSESLRHFDEGPEFVQFAIDHDADLSARNNLGQTVLHHAIAMWKQTELIEALLESGANPDIADNNGNLPIHFAGFEDERPGGPVWYRWNDWYRPSLEKIVAQTTNIDSINDAGLTALQVAVRNGRLMTAKFLVEHGSNDELPYVSNELPPGESKMRLRTKINELFASAWWSERL